LAVPFLNPRRLRDYPRLFLVSSWLVILLNVLLSQGWNGGLTGIMLFGDFISYYAGGMLFRTDASLLYDPMAQQALQEALIAPTVSAGFAPFISTPYVALAYSLLTALPLGGALVLWLGLSLAFAAAAVYLLGHSLLPGWLKAQGLTTVQLGVVIVSCFAFVIGMQAGQNHTLTLLLVTGIVIACRGEKWALAGLLAGLLAYKPQFALGFVVVWLVWRHWQALAAFGLAAGAWAGAALLTGGLGPYRAYLDFSQWLMLLPYAGDNFPVSIMATPYALLASLIPLSALGVFKVIYYLAAAGLTLGLALYAWRARNAGTAGRDAALALAIFYPLLSMPHTLVYDLLILAPAFLLAAQEKEGAGRLLLPAAGAYLGTLFLPLAGYPLQAALSALIPLGVFAALAGWLWRYGVRKADEP